MRLAPATFLKLAISSTILCAACDDCGPALDVVCKCESNPCDGSDPPAVVDAMRSCGENDVRPGDMNVHLCIEDRGAEFCKVLDGVLLKDGSICDVKCTSSTTCTDDLLEACLMMQYAQCDLPPEGNGS